MFLLLFRREGNDEKTDGKSLALLVEVQANRFALSIRGDNQAVLLRISVWKRTQKEREREKRHLQVRRRKNVKLILGLQLCSFFFLHFVFFFVLFSCAKHN